MPEAVLNMEAPTETEHRPGLPVVVTALSPDEVLARLDFASRRGRLPGFERLGGHGSDRLFRVEAHGHPFDAVLIGRHVSHAAASHLEFALHLRKKLPVVFVLVLIATVWPGVYFMDELIAQYLSGLWRPWVTYYWYLPLTILPIPWVWRGVMRRTRRTTEESAREAIARIAGEIDGRVEYAAHPGYPTPR
jgi:hypothetical protein